MGEEGAERKKLVKSSHKQVKRSQRLRKIMTPPELLIWSRLRPKFNKDFSFRRQVAVILGVIVDFYVDKMKIAFEIDGKIHALKQNTDLERDARLKQAGVTVVRISARRVFANPDGVANLIRLICLGEISVQDIK